MSIGSFITRQFTPNCYEDEIPCQINGHPIFPENNCNVDINSLRIITIHVSAYSINNSTIFMKSDPFCVMNINGQRGFKEYGRTEVCWNMLNPLWIRPFTFVVTSEPQLLLFEIYSVQNTNFSLNNQLPLGSCQLDLLDLINSSKKSIKLDIQAANSDKYIGKMSISFFDKVPNIYGAFFFKFSCSDIISSKRTLRKANPFFVIQRYHKDSGDFVPIFKSAVKSKTHSTDWEIIELPLQFLCGGKLDNPIHISLYDYFPSAEDSFLGFFVTTPEILSTNISSSFELRDPKGGNSRGKLHIKFLEHFIRPRLYDYRLQGVQLGAMLAIDFSSTPIDIIYSNRLTHTDNGVFSYRSAINDVCDALHPLTLGQPYFAFGFADFPNQKLLPLTLNKQKESIPTVKSILQAYSKVKDSCIYPDRASLTPVFKQAREISFERWEKERIISILIIITNGKFIDLKESLDELISNEDAPFSTIMVLMGGIKRDIDHTFSKKGGIVNSNGYKPNRPLIHVLTYMEDKIYPDNKLPLQMGPIAKRMSRQYLESISYNPWKDIEQINNNEIENEFSSYTQPGSAPKGNLLDFF